MDNYYSTGYSDPHMAKFIQYVRMFDQYNLSGNNQVLNEDSLQENQEQNNKEEINEDARIDEINRKLDQLFEDLSDIKSKFLNYTEIDADNEDYATGKEEGLYKAAEILEQTIRNKYEREL